jgi:hypothetical protein
LRDPQLTSFSLSFSFINSSFYFRPLLFFLHCLCDYLGPPSALTLFTAHSIFYLVSSNNNSENSLIIFCLLSVLIDRCYSSSGSFESSFPSNSEKLNPPWGIQACLGEILKDENSNVEITEENSDHDSFFSLRVQSNLIKKAKEEIEKRKKNS